ncbi:MAG: hypothetical protein EBX52_12855 [Proteobacteria bacterium]|nr:hypothetical protein [Pseudomonadota bacterium]
MAAAPSFADEFNPKTLLSDLPDGAVLVVHQDIELGSTTYNVDEYLHVGFEEGETDTDTELTVPGFDMFTRLLLRTNTRAAIERRRVSGYFYNYTGEFLRAGRYCLNRSRSDFQLRNAFGNDIGQERMIFELCSTGEAAFALYANAGWGMVHKQGQMHFTVGRFHYHSGKYMRFER